MVSMLDPLSIGDTRIHKSMSTFYVNNYVNKIISRIINFRINLIGCKKCEFKCTDRRYLSAHNRIEHRLQNENQEEENFIEKLIIIVKETSEHTELIMESLLEKAQGLVEELIDFKSAFPKCDNIRATVDGSGKYLEHVPTFAAKNYDKNFQLLLRFRIRSSNGIVLFEIQPKKQF